MAFTAKYARPDIRALLVRKGLAVLAIYFTVKLSERC